MRGPHFRCTIKSVIAILCAVCFLTMNLGFASRAIAADTWETWPRKTTYPGVAPNPETDAKWADTGGDATKENPSTGKSSGKTGWIAVGTAVVIGIAIAIAAGGGGGGGGGGGSTNPGHQ